MKVHHGMKSSTLPLPGEEHVAHGAHAFVPGGVGEQVPTGDVADRVDRLDRRSPATVDGDAAGTDVDADVLEPEIVDVRAPTDRDEDLVAA